MSINTHLVYIFLNHIHVGSGKNEEEEGSYLIYLHMSLDISGIMCISFMADFNLAD